MAGELPPTYYFSGITFNPSFYPSSSTGDYLTETTAKKLFLTYPIAQGPETISTLNCSVINSSSETSNLDLGSNITSATISIGDAQTSGSIIIGSNSNSETQIKGGTIKLMNNTNASGIIRSNYIDSLEFDSNLVIADTQTTGILQIANSSSRNGDVEIAKNATNGILTLGSNSNEGTNICGNIINLTNDTTASGQFTSTGILSGTIGILSGGIAYQTTNTAFGIPSTGRNQTYFLYCTGTATYTVVLPSVLTANQILYIRNGCSFALTLMTTEGSTKIYPTGNATVFTFQWTTFGANTAQRFFSNGTNWIGF